MRTVNLSILACSFWTEIECKFHGRYIFSPDISHRGFRLNRVWMVPEDTQKTMSTFIEAFIVLHSASRRGDSGLETVISMKKWNFESQNSTFCLSHSFLRALLEISEGTLKFQNSYLATLSKITTMIMVHPPENPSQHKNISGPTLWNWCSVGV